MRRPDGVSDAAVEAAGKVTEVLEWVERARGHLYEFHQLMGHADGMLDDAFALLRDAGRDDLADAVETEIVGRNVLDGRWTFQIVEEFDDGYWSDLRSMERRIREELTGGVRHVFESELKERRRTRGRPGHEQLPCSSA